MAAMSRAVARLAPVEPAMMVGPPAGARGEPCDLGFDQGRDTGRAIDKALLRQPVRPGGEGDFQEVEGDPPVAVVGVGRQRFERLRIDLVDDHVVDQRRKVAGERIGFRRSCGDQRRLAGVEGEAVRVRAADRAAQGLAPSAHERRQHVPAGEGADRGRRPGTRRLVRRVFGEGRGLVRLERAERRDARQDQARAPARRKQRLGQRRGGPLGRHVDRGVGQRQRPVGAGKALDQRAVEQGAAQRRQEGGAGGNREDAGGASRHALLSRRLRAKTRFAEL